MKDIDPDLDFTNLEPIEIPIPYGSVTYYLREASEDTHKQYRSRAMKCYDTDGHIKNPDMAAETPLWFVQMCLYKESGGDPKNRVDLTIVRNMPTRIVAKLFDKARKISGMDQEETAESIRKRISELQKQLEEIEQQEASGGIPPTS